MISGTSPFCETFFTDVKVPKENLVGEEGQGWTIGKRLLQHERTNIAGGGRLASMMGGSVGDFAKKHCETDADGELADKVLRAKIADFEIRWNSFLLTARRAVEESKAQGGVSEISSVLKKLGTQLSQERSELLIEIRGLQGLGWEGEGFSDSEIEAVRAWLFGKAATIYGGSTEIQNNIISKRVLGMLDHQ
jgi:alkylation response protein AidB-like acyl-CoA dehydrogenase